MSVFGYFGSVQATVYCLYFTSKTCTHNVNVYIFSTTNIKQLQYGDQKIEMFPDGWLTVNLQEGAIFSRSLNDNRRMIMTGLYFIRFSSQNVCFNSIYSKKKTQSWNRTVSSEPRLTDISVNRDSPRSYVCHPVLYKRQWSFKATTCRNH